MIYWPNIFKGQVMSEMNTDDILAQQLVGWGNIYMGYPPPDNFYEVMDEASKYTNAFTGVECREAADRLLYMRKQSQKQFLESLNDGYIVETSYDN